MDTPSPINPHWVLSIIAGVLFFPTGTLAVLFSYLCAHDLALGNLESARRYSQYVLYTIYVLVALALVVVLIA